jgi:starch synthase
MKVLAVTSELFPLVKTGGLADVTGALPLALAAENVETVTMLPGYPSVLAGLQAAETVHTDASLFGGPARLLRGTAAGLDLLVLDAPHLYARPGNPYTQPDGSDWPDNAARFAALGNVAAMVGRGGLPAFLPEVVHGHDWQAGLTMAYLRFGAGRAPGTVMTVHNLAFQGLFPAASFAALGLPAAAFGMDAVEFNGQVGYMKAGLALADAITTVSPTYAVEIQSPENGFGLDGLLRYRAGALHGILNGIDETVWNPATDELIASRFDAANIAPRAANKRAVQARFGLDEAPNALLLGVISRLTWQKGLDLLLDAISDIISLGAQLVVLGTGDRALESGFAAAAAAHAGRIGCVIGYDEALAHQMQAGIDALLVPSRFEPCGLTQLCALRYGALPVVARVGGLADTVIDANEAALAAGAGTGVQFPSGALRPALRRTAALWAQQNIWRRLQANAMSAEFSWRRPAAQYAALYRDVL